MGSVGLTLPVDIGLAIFLLGSVVGCVTAPYTVRAFSSDDRNQKTIKRMVGNSLGGPAFAYIVLDVQRSEGIDGEKSYDLVVTYPLIFYYKNKK